mgnify:CR=1 FL=1
MVVSITSRKENPIEYATELVDILVAAAGESHANLVGLQERANDHPDIPVYEKFTVHYFCLALEAQEIVNNLSYLEERTPSKPSSLSSVPPDMIFRLEAMAKRHGFSIKEDVLATIPYIPLENRQ